MQGSSSLGGAGAPWPADPRPSRRSGGGALHANASLRVARPAPDGSVGSIVKSCGRGESTQSSTESSTVARAAQRASEPTAKLPWTCVSEPWTILGLPPFRGPSTADTVDVASSRTIATGPWNRPVCMLVCVTRKICRIFANGNPYERAPSLAIWECYGFPACECGCGCDVESLIGRIVQSEVQVNPLPTPIGNGQAGTWRPVCMRHRQASVPVCGSFSSLGRTDSAASPLRGVASRGSRTNAPMPPEQAHAAESTRPTVSVQTTPAGEPH